MKNIKKTTEGSVVAPGKQRSYNEIIELLDSNWSTNSNDKTLSCIKKLNQALDTPTKKLDAVLVAGTNGKSLTIHFTTKLLKEEGVTVGTFYAPHILTYNERFALNGETISNKTFTDIANTVLSTAESEGLEPSSFEILTMMALVYFANNKVDIALLEVTSDYADTLKICLPKIAAITRITPDDATTTQEDIKKTLDMIQPGTWVVLADQSKLNLQTMIEITTFI